MPLIRNTLISVALIAILAIASTSAHESVNEYDFDFTKTPINFLTSCAAATKVNFNRGLGLLHLFWYVINHRVSPSFDAPEAPHEFFFHFFFAPSKKHGTRRGRLSFWTCNCPECLSPHALQNFLHLNSS
jgi:hypothetical protein